MAKKATAPKSEPSVAELKNELDSLKEQYERQYDSLIVLSESVDQQQIVITEVSKAVNALTDTVNEMVKFSEGGPTGVTNLDPNMNYQDCMRMALDSFFATQNVAHMMTKKEHLDTAVSGAIMVADAVHEALCEKFRIEE